MKRRSLAGAGNKTLRQSVRYFKKWSAHLPKRQATSVHHTRPMGRLLAAAISCLVGCPVGELLADNTVNPPSQARKSTTITRTDEVLVIDGHLDETAWQNATVVDDLRQMQPIEHAQPSERSEFRLLYDDDNLYIGARLWDSTPDKILRRQLVQDSIVFSDDHLELFVDPRDKRRGGYVFYLNPNGVQRDGLVFGSFESAGFNMNWDGIWQADATLTDFGWSAEVAIPFSTLDFDPKQPDWGMNFARWLGRKREFVGWSYRDRNPSIDSYGQVRGFEGLSQGVGLDVVPSVVLSDEFDFTAASGDSTLEPSLDLSYRITPSLTASLTLNTDFSATEVDDRQVNLTRFSLFFPEKRDFFLQNADIFEFGNVTGNGRPFFSRSIGLSGTGEPVDLTGGVKLAGRIGRWNVGALGVHQDAFADVDADTLLVARVSANVLDQSTIGAIVTSGDPSSNLDNTLVGVDFDYKNTTLLNGQSLEAGAWYQQSDTEGINGDDAALGLTIEVPNDTIDSRIRYTEIQANFNPALGFSNRTGLKIYEAHIRRRWRFDDARLRLYQARVSTIYITNRTGALETQAVRMIPLSIETQPGDALSLEFIRRREALFEPFTIVNGLTIPTGIYHFTRNRLVLNSSSARPLALNLRLEGGKFYTGRRFDTVAGLGWKPSRHFFMDLNYTTNRIDLDTGDFTTRILALKTNVAFNVKWAWINTLQHDNVSDRLGVNSRMRFIPRLGREAFFVVNYDFFVAEDNLRFESAFRGFTFKFSYNFRF